jgi:two-component system nitrate/nitrite sensor histidine kinase NarX
MRMQAYRMVLALGTGDAQAVPGPVAEFERSLQLLRQGVPSRPLFVPWDDEVRQRFAAVEQDWLRFRVRISGSAPPAAAVTLAADAAAFAAHIDGFVAGIEVHLSRWTSLMHLLQIALMALAVVGAAMLLYTGYLFVLLPVDHCLTAGDCHCGVPQVQPGARVIPIRAMQPARMGQCAMAGFQTVVSMPIRLHGCCHRRSLEPHADSQVSRATNAKSQADQ